MDGNLCRLFLLLYVSLSGFYYYLIVHCSWNYLFSSIFANENNTDDISNWYGTCCWSASSLILSSI